MSGGPRRPPASALPSPVPGDTEVREAARTEVYDPGRHEDRRMAIAALEDLEPTEQTAAPRAPAVGTRSEPIRVISMKDPSEAVRLPESRPLPQVQLRALSEIAKTPAPQVRTTGPRDGRAARARQQRNNVLWVLGGLVLAAAIALAIWLVAGR